MNAAPRWMVIAILVAFAPPVEAKEAEAPTFRGRTAESWASELTRGQLANHFWYDQPTDAFEAFREIGAAAVPVLVEKLQDSDRMVRHNSAEALMLMGIEAREALPALMHSLDDDDAEVRGFACDALGAMGIEAFPAIPRLQQLLTSHDESKPVRDAVARAIAAIEK